MKFKGHHPDYILIITVWALAIFGLAILSSASSDLGKIKFDDTYYYLKHQFLYGLLFGIAGFFLAYKISYRRLEKLAIIFLAINIVALALVLFTPLGIKSHGAERWLKIGPISVQPAEFLKFTFIAYLAVWFGSKSKRQTSFLEGFLPFFIVSGLIGGLLLLQPSTSSLLIIIGSALAVYFASGAKLSFILLAVVLVVAILAIVVFLTPYRLDRIMTYFKPDTDPQGKTFQVKQSLTSISTGGLLGVGYGKSILKASSLPEPVGDSIFAVFAEEFGFVGVILMIAVFLILLIRSFTITRDSPDSFAKLFCIGISSIITIQALIHISAVSGLIPFTGVPLPFISYGGSSLAVLLTAMGVIANISKHTR
jgi:cell division protein FtsW